MLARSPDPSRLAIGAIDVTDAEQIGPFEAFLGDQRFDAIFSNAGIYGPLPHHPSV